MSNHPITALRPALACQHTAVDWWIQRIAPVINEAAEAGEFRAFFLPDWVSNSQILRKSMPELVQEQLKDMGYSVKLHSATDYYIIRW